MNLTRSNNGMIAGVASGLAKSLNVDPTLVRLGFVLLSIFVGGGLLLYVVLWVILPLEGSDGGTIAQEQFDKARTWYDGRKNDNGPKDYDI